MNPRYANWYQDLRHDLLYFGRRIAPAMFTHRSPYLHTELRAIYHDEGIRQANIIAPRHSAKTSVMGQLAPLHHISVGAMRSWDREPEPRFVLLVSRSLRPHAINLLEDIKTTLESKEWTALFGDWGPGTAKRWANDEIVLRNGTTILSRGMTTQLRGLRRNYIRPSLVVLDDPEDENNTKTLESMEDNLRTLLQGLVPALAEPIGRIIVIGTPINARSMVMELGRSAGWKTIHRSCWKNNDPANGSYWPELFPTERLQEKKAELESIGRVSVFYREYECKITGDQEQLVRPGDIRWWDGSFEVVGELGRNPLAFLKITHLNRAKLSEPRTIPVNIFMGVDPASSTNLRANHTAIVPIAVDVEYNKYVLPYIQERLTPLDVAEKVITQMNYYKPLRTRVESVAYQSMLADYIASLEEGLPGIVYKENPRDAKKRKSGQEEYGRLDRMQPDFRNGKYYLKSRGEQEGMPHLKDQLLLYPWAEEDDLLDGLFYAQLHAYSPAHTAEDKGKDPAVSVRKHYDWLLA